MTNSQLAELYFIAAMMIMLLIFGIGAVYIFFRQLKREKAESAKFKKTKKEKNDEVD